MKKWKEYDLQVHTYVAEKFRESKDQQYKEIGVILERIRKIRNKADYQDIINFNILLAEAKNSVKSAKYVIQLLETLKKNN